MTTIAYRDGILAADTQGNWRDTPTEVSKIYKVAGYGDDAVYLAGSGILWRIREIVKLCELLSDSQPAPAGGRESLWKYLATNFYDKHHDSKPDDTPSCLLIQAGTGNVLWLDGPRFSVVTFNKAMSPWALALSTQWARWPWAPMRSRRSRSQWTMTFTLAAWWSR